MAASSESPNQVVFISYSHDSDAHRGLVAGLADRLRDDGFEARIDQHINGTPRQTWPRWMMDEIETADFVLVVCTETYYRRFRGHEAPSLGQGVDWEGALISQEIYDAKHLTTKFVPVLLSEDVRGFIPEPLRGVTDYVVTDPNRYEALLDFMDGVAGIEPAPVGTRKPRTRRQAATFSFGETGPAATQRVAPTRLTHSASQLFGRERELAALDAAWIDPATNVVTLVAWGGVGKTSLVAKWVADLAARGHDDADYFDWSFYSQGTREEGGASADAFVDKALRFFGDAAMADSPRSPWDKGARLAQILAERRTLLVLDGLEPLQHPPGPLAGELRDQAITALLKGLAGRNPGLCVVTTRERVEDLKGFEGSTAPRWDLEHLSTTAGIKLLKSVEVHGAASDLMALVKEVHGHALTLNLIGRYLVKAHGGDVRKRDLVEFSKADRKKHASNVMAAYETWLASGGEEGQRQLAVLRLLGLFDRPADPQCLAALRKEPEIPALTESLVNLDEADWNVAVDDLGECGLLVRGEPDSGLDAHPLVREHFGRRLRRDDPGAWKQAHGRLYDHLKDTTEHQPSTLEGLQPLYQAVVHGCHAGRHEEARAEVYRDRISRGAEAFVVGKLGAVGADLGAVACFFESPWSRVSASLTEENQAWLLNQAAFRLRALGRLTEAVEPMRAGLQILVEKEAWNLASASASNLSQLELTLGEVSAAVRDAEQSVDFADRSGDWFKRMAFLTTLADALHQAGRLNDALKRFREAESMQVDGQPEYPLLYSHQGFLYCDLLLTGAERAAAVSRRDINALQKCSEVEARAMQTLEWATPHDWILDIALDHLTLGRVRLYRSIFEGSSLDDAEAEIKQAVDGLRAAGQMQIVPLGLLTQAWLRFAQGDANGAKTDLDEAQEIAERGPMPLFFADIHLYRARFFQDRDALAEARRLVDLHGYARRLGELEDLEAAAESW